jgi:hypothetical protein
MCSGTCRKRAKSPLNVGDLVQIKVGKGKYKNALVTKRYNDRIVFVRYYIGDNDRELKMVEKYLYTLNKKCCSIVKDM